ncbi:MAG: DUF1700 domain-containing protein [Clostridia bacterium]|nr:DUF1700 domain-containing protein [Clostridia bacterium]MBR3593098.1 DUF1700 domain-containing protein [Clostridia bacterium]
MLKQEFLAELDNQLLHLSRHRRERAAGYYSGIIDGRMEGGMSEEEAVACFESVEKVALEFINSGYSAPSHRISKKIKSLPTALRLILSTAAVIFCIALIAAVWAVLAAVCLIIVLLALLGLGIAGLGGYMCFAVAPPVGICVIGGGIIVAAISLFVIGPARAITRFSSFFTKYITGKIRGLLAKEALSV